MIGARQVRPKFTYRPDYEAIVSFRSHAGNALGATVVHAMWQDALANGSVISTDATSAMIQPVKSQDSKRQSCKKGHFFTAVVDADHVLFAYAEKHNQEFVKKLFHGFNGFLQCDGYRIGCQVLDGRVRLESRNNRDWTERFPEVVDAVAQLPLRSALFDGEVAIALPTGRTSFQALQQALAGGSRTGLSYFVFDLLHLDGKKISGFPYEYRKNACEKLLRASTGEPRVLRYSEHFEVDGAALLERACALGAEGIISKRRDQPYRSGRNDGWLKTKCVKRQEFVVGGFTEPGGSRAGIGAFLVGHYEGQTLRFAGKVGTGPGFTTEYLTRVRRELDELECKDCPFDPPPRGLGRAVHWVEPVRTGEVTFIEWTEDGQIRHPSFQGFRDDKSPAEVQREMPMSSSSEETETPAAQRATLAGAAVAVVQGVSITSSERLVYPELGVTKLDLAKLYSELALRMLPYVRNRPLTLVRCEAEIRGSNALRKACRFLPHEAAWYRWAGPAVRRAQIQEQKKVGEYLVVDSPEALVALIQGNIVEIHVWNSTVDHLEQPDRIVMDLDPGPEVEWSRVVEGARIVRDVIADLGLRCWPKLTGGKGIHVVLPFEASYDWDTVYELSRRIADAVAKRQPEMFTTDFAKSGRARQILVDYKRNHRGAVAVAAYSTRANPDGTIGVPVGWRELKASMDPRHWTVRNIQERLSSRDPWEDFWTTGQRLNR